MFGCVFVLDLFLTIFKTYDSSVCSREPAQCDGSFEHPQHTLVGWFFISLFSCYVFSLHVNLNVQYIYKYLCPGKQQQGNIFLQMPCLLRTCIPIIFLNINISVLNLSRPDSKPSCRNKGFSVRTKTSLCT